MAGLEGGGSNEKKQRQERENINKWAHHHIAFSLANPLNKTI
jgi:hypothetical protein